MIAFVLAQTDHGGMIVNRMDYNRSFNGNTYGVGAQLMETHVYDASEVTMLKSLLLTRRQHHGDGVMAIDGGANIGVHAVEWSRLMRGWGGVVAVEAQERIFYALAGNFALHNVFNGRAIWAALGDQDGVIDIPEPNYTLPSSFGSFELKEKFGNEHIGQPINYDNRTLQVQMLRIDSLALRRVDLIKLDVEGMELEASVGAAATIERCKPILYIEVIKVDSAAVEDMLTRCGYVVFRNAMNILAVHGSDKSLDHVKLEQKTLEPIE